jgi:hypothetical protein
MRRDLVLPWIVCTFVWMALAIAHDHLFVWNAIGLDGEETSQLGSLKFWAEIVVFPPAAVLVCLFVIDRLFLRTSNGR